MSDRLPRVARGVCNRGGHTHALPRLGVLGDAATCVLTSDVESAPAIADRVLGKPISARELVGEVNELAEQRRRAERSRARRTFARCASAVAVAVMLVVASSVGGRLANELGAPRDTNSRAS
jgi:hypothetical protein